MGALLGPLIKLEVVRPDGKIGHRPVAKRDLAGDDLTWSDSGGADPWRDHVETFPLRGACQSIVERYQGERGRLVLGRGDGRAELERVGGPESVNA